MKKLSAIIVIFFILSICCISVCAETLPVKDMVYYDDPGTDIYVLLENGVLLNGNSPDTAYPTVVAENVDKVIAYSGSMYLLHFDGKITIIKTFDSSKGRRVCIVEDTLDVNAKSIVTSNLYIDNNDNLYTMDGSLLYENVRWYSSIYGAWSEYNGIIHTTKNELYAVRLKNGEIAEELLLLKDVDDFFIRDYVCIAYKNNGELYSVNFHKLSNNTYLMPLRISKNVKSINDVDIGDNTICYYLEDNNLYRFRCDSGEDLGLSRSNIKYFTSDYSIDTNGKVKFYSKSFQADNAKYFIGDQLQFYIAENGDLYKTAENNRQVYSKYFSNVRKVIIGKAPSGFMHNTIFIITNDGKLYSATGFLPKLETPFETAFCEKRTKVIINEKEIELKTKIQLVNNRSMYPFRECLENMGASVMWDAGNRIAIGEYNGITVEFPIDENYYFINGEIHYMDTVSYISDGKTYIPIRFAAEALGFTVEWESKATENVISIFE